MFSTMSKRRKREQGVNPERCMELAPLDKTYCLTCVEDECVLDRASQDQFPSTLSRTQRDLGIYESYRAGKSIGDLAIEFDLTRRSIHRIITRLSDSIL